MKLCTNCGEKLNDGAKFCIHCGAKIMEDTKSKNVSKSITKKPESNLISSDAKNRIDKINHKITLENNQSSVVKKARYSATFFILIILLAFLDVAILPIHPAVVMISIFFLMASLITGYMFKSRENKLQNLIHGEQLLAEWTLSAHQKKEYAHYLYKQKVGKNMFILFSIVAIAMVVFGVFILVIDEGKFAMFMVFLGLIVFLSFFAFAMPFYYKIKNSKGDGQVLIGVKYAYVNGYFHNWDFPLSGLSKVKIINDPFYGINFTFYYTDVTLKHSEELIIPANKDIDLDGLITKLKVFYN
ncbi:zinc-ribbon domain-containing protein [Polaribacter sp.]|uniref:zinc ribbon domain-containing protein n=1 Tax=Polaribacter sp. TaxID=1920175 RepID=UPI003EF97F6D